MSGFVSCDWGTTNLRLRWVDARAESIAGEVSSAEGVKTVFAGWRERGGERTAAYYEVLARAVARLEARVGEPLAEAVVVVSGMASSSIGIVELPYAELPFSLLGDGLSHRVLERPLPGGQPVVLLSGVRAPGDVMRGEETQLIGLRDRLGDPGAPTLYLLPGTHSKHAVVEGETLRDFRTFMTGELFEAVAAHTILRDSVRAGERAPEHLPAFLAGVGAAAEAPLPHALFRARTNTLFGALDPAANYWFLSGVLIGAELLALRAFPRHRLRLCAAGSVRGLYEVALEALGLRDRAESVPAELVEQSAAWGQLAVFRRIRGR